MRNVGCGDDGGSVGCSAEPPVECCILHTEVYTCVSRTISHSSPVSVPLLHTNTIARFCPALPLSLSLFFPLLILLHAPLIASVIIEYHSLTSIAKLTWQPNVVYIAIPTTKKVHNSTNTTGNEKQQPHLSSYHRQSTNVSNFHHQPHKSNCLTTDRKSNYTGSLILLFFHSAFCLMQNNKVKAKKVKPNKIYWHQCGHSFSLEKKNFFFAHIIYNWSIYFTL